MSKNVIVAVFLALTLGACGRHNPTGPTPPPPPPPSMGWTVSGQVVSNPDGQPISAANISVDGLEPIQTDISGNFSLSSESGISNRRTVVSALGFLERGTGLQLGTNHDGVSIDIIRNSAPFSLNFYQQFARNTYDNPSHLRNINRHINPPRFYISTTDENGQDIPRNEIDMIGVVIRKLVPQLTGNRFQTTMIETGREKRSPTFGEIRVSIFSSMHDGNRLVCGTGGIDSGGSGQVNLAYVPFQGLGVGCGCVQNYRISPRTVGHEVGHAMGFFHHNSSSGIMYGVSRPICSSGQAELANLNFSSEEQLHAGIAYSRPNGNTNPDNDPVDFRLASPLSRGTTSIRPIGAGIIQP